MTLTVPGAAALPAEHLISITADVWLSFLEQELVPDPRGDEAPEIEGRTVTGCVHISGAWEGSVFLQVTAESAIAAAETMFMAEPGSLAFDEVCDGLGELTNMVGGNIKSLLPGPSTLSLPSVAEGVSYTVRVPQAVRVHRVALVGASGPVLVSVWKASS